MSTFSWFAILTIKQSKVVQWQYEKEFALKTALKLDYNICRAQIAAPQAWQQINKFGNQDKIT